MGRADSCRAPACLFPQVGDAGRSIDHLRASQESRKISCSKFSSGGTMEIAPWEAFIRSTALHVFVRTYEPLLWPACETLHYLALSVLLGTVGFFDLRVLGL